MVSEDFSELEREFLHEMRLKKKVSLPCNSYWEQKIQGCALVMRKFQKAGLFRKATLQECVDHALDKSRLVEELRLLGLPVSGNKSVLIERLCECSPEHAEMLVSQIELYIPV
ncbi:hypothetical protein CEK28_04850 [Xenophilus sp. AP218F]|nr:hypothetical protein CEK28_04850 [Xenophilus sp. AP218F]